MKNTSKFEIDLKVGEIGEEIALEFFQNNKGIYKVEDVRDSEFWRDKDVDFIITTIEGIIFTIEVKSDTMAHRTGNIVYEHTSNKYKNTLGCFRKTKADYILYYITETKEMYKIHTYSLREYIDENKKQLREVSMGDNALGYLVRIQKLVELEIMQKIIL